MPKRVMHGEGVWASDKLALCPDWMRPEYCWLHPLADAYGSFEITNLRVLAAKVGAIRDGYTEQKLAEIFEEFQKRGLLFIWVENKKKYGHWTGSDIPGRLPGDSRKGREERLAPPVKRQELKAYLEACGFTYSSNVFRSGNQKETKRKPVVAQALALALASASALASGKDPPLPPQGQAGKKETGGKQEKRHGKERTDSGSQHGRRVAGNRAVADGRSGLKVQAVRL